MELLTLIAISIGLAMDAFAVSVCKGLKMQKIKEHGIAGAAYWKLGLETPDVWPVIKEYLQ